MLLISKAFAQNSIFSRDKFLAFPHTLTQNVSESAPRRDVLSRLIVIVEQIRAQWLGSDLPKQGRDLAAMVTGMVDHMHHLPPERVGVAFSSRIGVGDLILEAVGNQRLNVLVLVIPNCCPMLLKGWKSGEVRCVEECFRRASKPALQPDPFRAKDVGECVAHRAKAIAHVA